MLTCKEASYLASKKLDEKLTWRESLNFRLHIMMCGLCRRYAMEMKKFHHAMQKAGESSLSLLPESVKLSRQSRERIKQAIDKALHQTD
jgi:predicted anti-sigma-YlaC factor YlaD